MISSGIEFSRELSLRVFFDDEAEFFGLVRRICHGERARNRLPFFRGNRDVDILPRPELYRRAEFDLDAANVVGQVLDQSNPAVERLHGDRFRQNLLVVVEKLDFQIGVGDAAAQKDVAALLLHVVQRESRVFQHVDFAIEQHALAGRALPFLAAVRQGDALAERSVEHRFAMLDIEFDADRAEPDRVGFRHTDLQ